MPIQPLNIAAKVDNPDKLAATASIPPEQKVLMTELNALIAKANELVAAMNYKTASLNEPNDNKFPTSKAVADALALKVDKSAVKELAIAPGSDPVVKNLDPQGAGALSFTSAVELTGIKSEGLHDGSQIIVYNNNEFDFMTIEHSSTASLPENRIYLLNEEGMQLKPKSWVILRFSEPRNRWEMINVYGTSVMPDLAYDGNEMRAVVVGPDGVCYTENVMDYLIYDDETPNGFGTLAEIAIKYPTANGYRRGFTVVCRNTTPPSYYRKDGDGDEEWTKHEGIKLL